ncbi:MAG: hypothetical protein JW913_01510 [Chitinispirillaceae bacterium]|nr:hypothetical protein [Chitinispirillaceae bacterium]
MTNRMIRHKFYTTTLLTCGFLLLFGPYAYSATVTLNYDCKYQTIEGFGGGLSFRKYPYFHPKKEELYDSIFNVARINVVRIHNYYNLDPTENELVEIPMMMEIQQRWPDVKTILTSWSPPSFLKSNNSLVGGNERNDTGTIKKNSDGLYMYDEYGYYWLKSAQYFINSGIRIGWVSIQNEPDCAAWYEGCVLGPTETPTIASYGRALNSVYTAFQQHLASPPPLIGPDVVGVGYGYFSRYLNSPDLDRNQLVAYCHHLYHYSGPDLMVLPPRQFPDKPIYQTEFLINEGEKDRTWFDHAVFIHNSLAIEGVSMYCIFALAYKPASTHCLFSMDTSGGVWYETRPIYYMFKHFSRSIHRGWRRCEISVDDPNLLVSAYCNADNDSTAIVIINAGARSNTVNLLFPGKRGDYYQTTESSGYVYKGSVSDSATIACDIRSITTIDLRIDNNAVKHSPIRTLLPSTRIVKVRKSPSGVISVRYFVPIHEPATLSLLDFRGTVLAEYPLSRHDRSKSNPHHFDRSVSSGSYIITLKSGTAIAVRNFIVID